MRSDLNAQLRDVKNEFGANSPLVAVLSQNINAIEQAMDLSASKLNPRLKEAYRETSNFYRESTTELFPESLAKLNNKTVTKINKIINIFLYIYYLHIIYILFIILISLYILICGAFIEIVVVAC